MKNVGGEMAGGKGEVRQGEWRGYAGKGVYGFYTEKRDEMVIGGWEYKESIGERGGGKAIVLQGKSKKQKEGGGLGQMGHGKFEQFMNFEKGT